MANYPQTKNIIDTNIVTNHNEEITAVVLNTVLTAIIDYTKDVNFDLFQALTTLELKVGSLNNLNTVDKSSVVNAINEVASNYLAPSSAWTIPCTLLGDGLEQGDNVLSFTAPFDFKITKIVAYVYDIPTGQAIHLGVAIDETAVGVIEPFIVIPANNKKSTNTPDIVGVSISEEELISINVVQVGSINTGDCLTLYIEYEKL